MNTTKAKELPESFSLFFKQDERGLDPIKYTSKTFEVMENSLPASFWENPELNNGEYIVSFDIEDSSKAKIERAILCSWESEKGNHCYHFRYLHSGGFSPRLLEQDKDSKLSLSELLQMIINQCVDGLMMKRDSFIEDKILSYIEIYEANNLKMPVFSAIVK